MMNNQKSSLTEFIDERMFLNLASCILLVSGMVELLKQYTDLNPLWLNLIISGIVTLVRLALIGDFSFRGVVLGVFNLVPILLGATGMYEFLKNIMGGGN